MGFRVTNSIVLLKALFFLARKLDFSFPKTGFIMTYSMVSQNGTIV